MSFKPNIRKLIQLNQQILFQINLRNFTSKAKEPNWNELPKCQVPKCDVVRLDDVEAKEKPFSIQESWNECKKPVEPKKYSCDDHPQEKSSQKRQRKTVPDNTSACKSQPQPQKLNVEDCVKLTLENCDDVNSSTKCMSYRPIVDCKKVPAPKPSFSECQKDKIGNFKKTECKERELK